jgi:flagellar biosynthesis/type III secretory pathway ATPase
MQLIHGKHVLGFLTGMSSYADALREVSAASEEVSAARGMLVKKFLVIVVIRFGIRVGSYGLNSLTKESKPNKMRNM